MLFKERRIMVVQAGFDYTSFWVRRSLAFQANPEGSPDLSGRSENLEKFRKGNLCDPGCQEKLRDQAW